MYLLHHPFRSIPTHHTTPHQSNPSSQTFVTSPHPALATLLCPLPLVTNFRHFLRFFTKKIGKRIIPEKLIFVVSHDLPVNHHIWRPKDVTKAERQATYGIYINSPPWYDQLKDNKCK